MPSVVYRVGYTCGGDMSKKDIVKMYWETMMIQRKTREMIKELQEIEGEMLAQKAEEIANGNP